MIASASYTCSEHTAPRGTLRPENRHYAYIELLIMCKRYFVAMPSPLLLVVLQSARDEDSRSAHLVYVCIRTFDPCALEPDVPPRRDITMHFVPTRRVFEYCLLPYSAA